MTTVLNSHRSAVLAAAAGLPLLACAVLTLVRDTVANTNAALGLVLLVVAAASTGIRAAGLVAALSSAVGFDFFLTPPYLDFTITKQADIETAVLLVLVGAAVTEVALWGRRQQARASRQQGYLDGVLGTAATVSAGRTSTGSLVERVRSQLIDVLQVERCRFDPTGRHALASINPDASVSYAGHPIDAERAGLPTDSEIALEVRSGGVVYGRYLLTAATRVVRVSPEQCRVAIALADQVGAALAAASGDRRRCPDDAE